MALVVLVRRVAAVVIVAALMLLLAVVLPLAVAAGSFGDKILLLSYLRKKDQKTACIQAWTIRL